MRVRGIERRTIERDPDGRAVLVIDQTLLPHRIEQVRLAGLEDAARAIERMVVRGAPLIGATAAYGVAMSLRDDPSDAGLEAACARLLRTRPTAVNLRWALAEATAAVRNRPHDERVAAAYARADAICEDDIRICRAIGEHGVQLIEAAARAKPAGGPVDVLTHCNAGWLGTIDRGTATAPIYRARDLGIPVHVWVDETRPRNQGALLTAFELAEEGIAHTVIADNAGGHLMRQGMVDLCIVGSDRTTANGDVCNKIGTYLKALAAADNGVPFHVALPSTTIDWTLADGDAIPIEQRDGAEVATVSGRTATGEIVAVRITPDASPVANYAFDVTPARLVTGLITERGLCPATREGLAALFPEAADGVTGVRALDAPAR